jgi:ribitol-5-phosphate 2-dehydrogenase (NADP+) / D-ribitol-5-phosphate cytidylyltransferase
MSEFSKQGTKAILLMGGEGARFKSDLPKQFHRISGKKVYLHTLDTFIKSELFEEIILVCQSKWISEVKEELKSFSNIKIVPGGSTRQESSYLGLLACGQTTKIVVIHDAVRPFVSREILQKNVEAALLYQAVDTCIPSADTIVHSSSGEFIDSIPNRSEYLRGQTPQSFSYPLIVEAHKRALSQGLTNSSDDCRLVLDFGKKIHIVSGEERNIKITTELDLFLAEQLLRLPATLPSHKNNASLTGKRFIITGGTGGIGQAIVSLLQKEGAHPLVVSKSSFDHPADLTSYTETTNVFEKIGPVDGLINCVGLLKNKAFSELSHQEIEELIAVNLKTLLFSCKAAQIKEGGHIVNIASSSYFKGRKGTSIYSSTKAAVVNFSQALAEERPDIAVNVVVPQRTLTKMRKENFPNEEETLLLSPDKVAEAIVELLKQKEVTGNILEVRNR